jgi:hypothetical protein
MLGMLWRWHAGASRSFTLPWGVDDMDFKDFNEWWAFYERLGGAAALQAYHMGCFEMVWNYAAKAQAEKAAGVVEKVALECDQNNEVFTAEILRTIAEAIRKGVLKMPPKEKQG